MVFDKFSFNIQLFATVTSTNVKALTSSAIELGDTEGTYLIRVEKNATVSSTPAVKYTKESANDTTLATITNLPASTDNNSYSGYGLLVVLSANKEITTFQLVSYSSEDGSSYTTTDLALSSGNLAEALSDVDVALGEDQSLTLIPSTYTVEGGSVAITSGALTVTAEKNSTEASATAAVITAPAEAVVKLGNLAYDSAAQYAKYEVNGITFTGAATAESATLNNVTLTVDDSSSDTVSVTATPAENTSLTATLLDNASKTVVYDSVTYGGASNDTSTVVIGQSGVVTLNAPTGKTLTAVAGGNAPTKTITLGSTADNAKGTFSLNGKELTSVKEGTTATLGASAAPTVKLTATVTGAIATFGGRTFTAGTVADEVTITDETEFTLKAANSTALAVTGAKTGDTFTVEGNNSVTIATADEAGTFTIGGATFTITDASGGSDKVTFTVESGKVTTIAGLGSNATVKITADSGIGTDVGSSIKINTITDAVNLSDVSSKTSAVIKVSEGATTATLATGVWTATVSGGKATLTYNDGSENTFVIEGLTYSGTAETLTAAVERLGEPAETVDLSNIDGLTTTTTADSTHKKEDGTANNTAGATVTTNVDDTVTQVKIKVGETSTDFYVWDTDGDGTASELNTLQSTEAVSLVVSTIEYNGSALSFKNSDGGVVTLTDAQKEEYAKVSDGVITLGAKGKSADITVKNTGSEKAVVVTDGTFIASLVKSSGTINGDGSELTTAGSWSYASKTLTIKTDDTDVTVKDITGIDATTTVANSSGTVTVTKGGTNVVYGGLTLTSGAMDIDSTKTTGNITLKDEAVATTSAALTLSIANGGTATVNSIAIKATNATNSITLDASKNITKPISVTFTATAAGVTVDGVKYVGTGSETVAFGSTSTDVTPAAGVSITDTAYKNTYKTLASTTDTIKINGVTVVSKSTTSQSVMATTDGFKVGTGAVNVTGDSDYTLTAAGDNGNLLSGIGAANGVTLSGAGLQNGKVTTDSVGSFTIGKSAYSIGGDSSVVFGIASAGVSVDSVTDLDGTVVGDFTTAIKVNGSEAANAINVTGDKEIGVVGEGETVTELQGISDKATVVAVGGATKVVTDTVGSFTFGSDATADKYTISGDSSVEFAVSGVAVSGINSIDGAAVLTATKKEISLNDTAVTLSAADSSKPYTVSFASGKIGTVSGASLVSGVENALIVETTAAQIGTTAVNITGDKNYGISVLSGDAIGEISSISGGATVTGLANATLKTDSNGTFTFGTIGYEVAGDTEVQFVTGESNGTVSAINNLEGTVKTSDKEITINGDEVVIGGISDASVVTYTGGTTGIDSITGLTNNATVTGATNAALNLVGTSSTSVATSLTANGNLFQLLNDSDGVTITGGEVVTGLGSGASLVASNAGTYTVNGTVLNVAAGETIRGTSEGTAEIYSAENVSEVDTLTAASVESLASALGIDTSDYATVSNDAVEAAISSSSAADKSVLDGNLKFATSVPSGATSQEVDLSANTGVKDVTLTTGNQTLKFNNEGGNIAQVGAEAKGTKDIELGGGGDIAIIAKGTKATVNVVAGRGSDSIVSGANASVDVGNGGATKVRAIGGATVTMNNYNAADSKAGVQTTNSDIAAAIGNGNITLENGVIGTSEGKVALNSGSASADVVTSADSGDTEGSTIANLYNNAGKMTKVGFTHSDGGTVDLSSQKANTVIQGNSTGTKKNESTLLGGSGNDTVFAGSGDVIDAGAGANTIELFSSSSVEVGATVQMTSATGRNNIDGFSYGFGDSNDAISLDMTNAKFSIDGDGNLIVKNGRAKSTLLGASADGDTSYAQVLIKDTASGETTKAAVAKEGNVISVSSDEDNFANNYIGDGSGLSFSSYESEVNLNLAGTTATFGGEEVQVSGINNVTLGEADATVFGSSAKETITAGNGNETIWAGAGKDTLNGYSGNADDKSGSITFGFMAGDGKDVINNFGYLTTENAQTADRVWTTGQFEAALSGSDVVLSFSGNKKDSLRLAGMAGKNIQLSENGNLESVTTVLQVNDTLLTYDGLATKYVATGSNAAVVATSDTATANIWLEDKYVNLSNNTTYTGKITAINAAAVEGQATLVGNSYDNVITGAQGSSSMWGGDSTSNDTMIGGTEGNMFFYGVTGGNEGNDTISGITEDDTVNLFGIQLSDIDLANTSITNSAISLKFNAGGSLTMGNNGQTFMLANDQNQRYTYDKENSQWAKA